ncbi:MAG: hypothetical protein ACYCPP_05515 [Nitrososphaerales archaeon]
MTTAITENLQESSDKLNESLESVKQQLFTYGSQIQEYLGTVNANIDGYKFSVEKQYYRLQSSRKCNGIIRRAVAIFRAANCN